MKGLYIGFFLVFSSLITSAQFTSVIDGNWNDGATWGNTSPGTAGVDYPSGSAQDASIASNVTVPASYGATVRNVTVGAGYVLTIANSGSIDLYGVLTVEDDGLGGNGILDISGSLIANEGSSFVNDSPTSTTVNGTGKYTHNFTTSAGNLLQANWASGSTCEVIGYTTNTTAPGNLGQSFHHFTWNCPTGGGTTSSFISFAGLLNTINGNLTVSATGGASRTLRIFDTSSSKTLTVGGDVILNGSSRLVLSTSGTANQLVVSGNFNVSNSATSQHTLASSGSATVTVVGNFSVTSSSGTTIAMASLGTGSSTLNVTGNLTFSPSAATTLNMASQTTSSGAINLAGNFSANSFVTLASTATSGSDLTFNGSAAQSFSNTGTVGKVNFRVNNGAILDLGSSALTGTGTFTLLGGGTLRVGSADGLVTGSTSGNIRVNGTRTYTAFGNIIYNGSVAQSLGNEWGSTGALNGVTVNLEISNANGVTNNITGNTNLVGTLRLTNGPLHIGNSNTLGIQNNFIVTGGTIGGSASSNLTFGGSGTLGTLNFATGAESLNNLTVGRVGDLVLGTDLTVGGTIDLSFGNLDFSGHTLTMNGGSITSSGTGLKSNSSSNLIFGGSSYSGSIPFSGSGNQLNNLTFSTPGGTFTLSSAVTVNTNVTLTAGSLTHTSGLTMASNSTFIKGAGTFSGTAPGAVTSYNVTYTGTGNTGAELPTSSTALANLTISSSGTVSLNSTPITINGNAIFSSGTFSAGSNSIVMKGSSWSASGGSFSPGTGTVTFGGTNTLLSGASSFNNIIVAGTVTLSSGTTNVSGSLSNSGTLNAGSGIVNFNGTTTITGSSATSFNDVIVSNTLTAPSTAAMNVAGDFTNNGTFNHNNGSIVFNGTTSILGSVASSFYSVSITGTLTSPTTFNVAGNLSSSGTFNNSSGTLVLNGTVSAQSITGTLTLYNVDVSNPSGVNNNGNVSLTGTLSLVGSGIFDADGSGSGILTIRSTAVNAGGRIASLATPANFRGQATVERFVNGPAGWRYLSMPLTNGNAGMWQSVFPVTGNFSNPSPAGVNNVTNSSAPSIYYWDAATAAYVAVGSGGATGSTTLSNLTGYSAYTYLSGDFTISASGTVRTGNASVPVASSGYALVSNPYPSAIDWDNITRTGFSNTMSVRVGNGVFASYVAGGLATNPPYGGWTGEVAIGQSFWVESTGATSLGLTESAKTSAQYQFLREAQPQNYVRVALSSETQRDEALVWFVEGASSAFDQALDAKKMRNGLFDPGEKPMAYLNIASVSPEDQAEYAINAIAPLSCNTVMGLKMTDVKAGKHTLSFTDMETMLLDYHMVLVDRFAGIEKVLTNGTSYEFTVSQDSASFAADRFALRFLMPGSVYINSLTAPPVVIQSPCDAENLSVTVQTQNDVLYQFFKDGAAISEAIAGNGDLVTVTIPKNQLSAGANALDLEASTPKRCDRFLYKNALSYDFVATSAVEITQQGTALASNISSGNQWYKDGELIADANSSTFDVTESGTYSVSVSFGGCIVQSENIEIVVDALAEEQFKVYPNPTSDKFSFVVPDEISKGLKAIALHDMRGITVVDHHSNPELLMGGKMTINLTDVKAGLYILRIISADKTYHLKIMRK